MQKSEFCCWKPFSPEKIRHCWDADREPGCWEGQWNNAVYVCMKVTEKERNFFKYQINLRLASNLHTARSWVCHDAYLKLLMAFLRSCLEKELPVNPPTNFSCSYVGYHPALQIVLVLCCDFHFRVVSFHG